MGDKIVRSGFLEKSSLGARCMQSLPIDFIVPIRLRRSLFDPHNRELGVAVEQARAVVARTSLDVLV